MARALGDVSVHQVWRVLRRYSIHLRRRRSWCLSTDPQFAQKAADIVGLYFYPPENAVVVCADEKPAIPALERAQGWLRLPNGEALREFSHEYKRHGTTTLFAALEAPDYKVEGLIATMTFGGEKKYGIRRQVFGPVFVAVVRDGKPVNVAREIPE